jgi:hypothetical protein
MKRLNFISLLVVVVLTIAICLYLQNRAAIKHGAVAKAVEGKMKSSVASSTIKANTQPEKVFHVLPGQTLAMVNGKPITLKDLIPLTASGEQEISQTTYNYLLDRAMNRELILQAAKARGITLTESEEDHLAQFRGLREQSEPGLVSKFTVNPAEVDFEIRDAEAFMLQTSLMAQMGVAANVTPDQVSQYYQDHIAEFGPLPADPQESQSAWQKIDFEIRGRLASEVRTEYNAQLQTYMNQLKASAQITTTPMS